MPRAKRSAVRPKPRGAYHHKDLKRALVDAALALIDEQGLEAVTIRTLARRLGVSHAAPAHHFADRQALLDEVATQSFFGFCDTLEAASSRLTDPVKRLEAIGVAYVRFAVEHPAAFRAMMTRGPPGEIPAMPELEGAVARAFGLLHGVATALVEERRLPRSPEEVSLAAWAQVHGLARLWIDGPARWLFPGRGDFEAAAARAIRLIVERVSTE
jgi:AcrR family transcriptional regulator